MYPIKHVRSSVLSGLVHWRGFAWESSPPSQGFWKCDNYANLKKTCMQATLPVYVHVLSQVNCHAWLQGIKVVQLLKLTQAYTPTNIHNSSTSLFKQSTTYHHQSLIHSHTKSKSNHHKMSTNLTLNQRSPIPEKAILALNKPWAWRLRPRGVVINTNTIQTPICQHQLNAK